MNPQAETINRRVLVIDDNQAIVEDFRKILGAGLGGNGALARAEAALFGDDDGSDDGALHPEFEIDSANQGQEDDRQALAPGRRAWTTTGRRRENRHPFHLPKGPFDLQEAGGRVRHQAA